MANQMQLLSEICAVDDNFAEETGADEGSGGEAVQHLVRVSPIQRGR